METQPFGWRLFKLLLYVRNYYNAAHNQYILLYHDLYVNLFSEMFYPIEVVIMNEKEIFLMPFYCVFINFVPLFILIDTYV